MTYPFMIQELTFEDTAREFAKRSIEFGAQQMKTLKIINPDGIYTNLGLLLSEQCAHTIKAAVFEGTNQNAFKDRREFTGSLMRQMNEAYDYIDFRNQTHSDYDKLVRKDRRDYPEMALREALLNLLAHRDYAYSASALISIYDDRIEFVSVGGLMPGIEIEDIMTGISVCRNQNLANVFYRLELIEAYGTGMRKIMSAYDGTDRKPIVETTNNTFKIVLPNMNFASPDGENSGLTDRELWVREFIHANGHIVRSDVEEHFAVSTSTAARLLRSMVYKGIIKKIGGGRGVEYV